MDGTRRSAEDAWRRSSGDSVGAGRLGRAAAFAFHRIAYPAATIAAFIAARAASASARRAATRARACLDRCAV